MTLTRGALALVLGAPMLAALPAHAQDPSLLDEIVVTGVRRDPVVDHVRPEAAVATTADSSGLVARLPGAARVDNGGLSGQVQYRGLFGERVLVRINGQRFHTGGPNAMDPPLHYAPMPLVARMQVDRGVSPVRNGPALAGGVNAELKQVDFADGPAWTPVGDLSASWRSIDDGYSFGGVAGAANDRFRLNLIGAREKGGDTRFPGGVIRDSAFERDTYGLSGGFRSAAGDLSLDLRGQETGPTGTPPFSMDIRFFDTDFARLAYAGPAGAAVQVEASLGHSRVEHGMDNFSLRPGPAMPTMRRLSLADAESLSGDLRLAFDAPAGRLNVGADFERADKSVSITHPDNPDFLATSLPGIETGRLGGHVEWRGTLSGVEAEIGVRADAHRAEAGLARTGPALPVGPTRLAAAFNAGDRSWSGGTYDVAARFWRDLGDFTPRLTLARKTRVPTPVERFSWLPTEASGGLADGNIYVGEAALRPEIAWIAEAGFDWRRGGAWARPTIYYRRVDDYIQGVAYDATPGVADSLVEMVSAANGDATPLRWANADAELYGFDVDFGAALTDRLRLEGTASHVRGRRRDIEDDLYRIAPPNLRLAAIWEEADWSLGLEATGALRQRDVSTTNGEAPSGGYAVFALRGERRLGSGVTLEAGIDNLFGREYRPHLAGRNRVAGSDVAVGERLPGAGRGVFVTLRSAW